MSDLLPHYDGAQSWRTPPLKKIAIRAVGAFGPIPAYFDVKRFTQAVDQYAEIRSQKSEIRTNARDEGTHTHTHTHTTPEVDEGGARLAAVPRPAANI